MKNKIKLWMKSWIAVSVFFISAILPNLSNAGCYENEFLDTVCPYLGIEAKWQSIIGRSDWSRVFQKSHAGGSLFIGSRFSEFLGIEAGYTELFENRKRHVFAFNENFFGNGNTAGAVTRTSTRFSSGYIDLNGYYPCFDGCFDFIGTIGISAMEPRMYIRVADLGSGGTGFLAEDAARLEQIKGQTKAIFRLGAGAQYMFCDCIGLRGMVRFENTSALRLSVPSEFTAPFNTDALRRPFRDSISVALGVFAAF